MKLFKYTLDTSSTKFICPSCGKKRLVKFIDIETKQYIEDHCGRCDRETNCGYFLAPNENSGYDVNYTYTHPSEKPTYHDPEIVKKSIRNYTENHLLKYLYSIYNNASVDKIAHKYMIGTANLYNGGTVYWQIDHTGNIRGGKIMAYDSKTGKRKKRKDGNALINWAHSVMKIPEFNLSQCVFGLHLLKKETKQIAIVESEKTALIMNLEIPKTSWMATGSLTGFKYEYLKPFKEIKVIAYPDKGGYNIWSETANKLNKQGFNITVSNILEKDEYEKGWDLADVVEYQKKTINYTRTEKIVKKYFVKNPVIKTLIKTFDLVDEYDQKIRLNE